jgi:hypothetical protein
LDNTLGALIIGSLLSMTLWGVTCVQTYEYFRIYNDTRLQKFIIGFLWTMDTLSSALIVFSVYAHAIENITNPMAVVKPLWAIYLQLTVTAVIAIIIRTTFIRRIYALGGKNILLLAGMMGFAICDFVILTTITALEFRFKTVTRAIMYLSFAMGALADCSIAVTLCLLLHSARTGFGRTDTIVTTLISYMVTSGLFTAVFATLSMVMALVFPFSLIGLAFFLLHSKLFLNSYLASLNARERLRERDSEPSVALSRMDATKVKALQSTRIINEDETNGFHNPKMAITFETSVERRVDYDSKYEHPIV